MKALKSLLVALALLIFPLFGWSQVVPCSVTLDATLGGLPPVPPVYNMSNGSISTCSGVFYDPGGTGNYGNSTSLITQTFCSDQPGEQIILDFSAYGFQVETSFDFLNIYDGTGTGGTQLWNSQTSGGATNPGVITSTTGCLTITFSSDGSVTYQGWQADISCTNPSSNVFDCNGGDVTLTAVGQGQQTTVMSNNFNSGLGSGWVSTGGSAVGSPCGPSLDGTDYYWASTSTGTPNLTTIDYDVSCGGTLTFDMAYATQGGAAPCEGPDLPDEGVTLQYSTDGGITWIVIQYWDPNGGYDPQMTAWNTYSIPIPIGAQGPNTQFQWIQNNSSGTCCDNWGVDNVMITANTNCAAYWYDYNHIAGFPDPSTDVVNITSTTTFGVWYTNGTDSCYASTTVIVPPGTTADAGPDQTICSAGNVTIGAAPTTPDIGATYTWSTGATGTISGGDNGQISVAPLVTTDYFLEVEFNGCIAYDTVTVFVDAPPTASNPLPVNVQCSSDVPAPDPLVVTDENDDITIPPSVTFLNDVSDGQSCPETITRTYRVEDACGNYVDVQQTITVNDTQAPVFNAPPATANVQCSGDIPAMTNLGWSDNCDGSGNIAGSDVSDGLSCPETITRTWTYTDGCGNSATETQIITVNDTQAPVFNSPPVAANVQCSGDVPAMTNLTWTDNCDGTGNIAGSDVSDGLSCPETITRSWTYTDGCGNLATETQTITVNDTQAPVLAAAPAGMNVQCSGDVPAMANLGWTDNCDGTGSSVGSEVSDGQSCPETITRTWTYTDGCGNTSTETQVITVNDTQAPVLTAAPAGMNVQCSGDVPAMANLGWTDNCDGAGSSVGSEVSDGQSCPETITRTWTYTDGCGNTATETQVITVNDTQAPVLTTAPAGMNVQCSGDVPAMANLGWIDNCDGAGSTVGSEVSDGQSCPETITRTWTYTDGCGNTATETQVITVNDTQAPVFNTPPATANVQCSGDVPAMTNLTWTDNCDGTGSVVGSDVSDGQSCPETITRTWTFTDGCGNASTETQTIIVDDITPPTASNPTAIAIAGGTPIPNPDPLVVNDEADNCTVNPIVAFVSDVSDNGVCPEIITRTYSVTDDCGNETLVTQLISIGDAILPSASNPIAINVQCSGDVPVPDPLVVTDETDNGAMPPVVTFENDVSDGQSCPEIITRTYRITDDCGNFVFVTQTITVHDTQAPVLNGVPADASVECTGDVPAMINLDWTDNCDGAGSIAGNDVSDGLSCPETITRTWTYTDACGNSATETQTIIVNDTQAPVFSAPPVAANVQCSGDVPAMMNLAWTDNCDGAGSVAGNDVSDGLSCPETITRTWTYTDACGNAATQTQVITVNDTQAPVFNPTPANVTVQCSSDVPAMVNLDWTDNCDGAGAVAGNDVSDGLSCPETITRTWTFTDACGNTSTEAQTIIVDDTTPPTASNPAPISVPGANDVPAPDPSVVIDELDNCTANPIVTFVSEVSDGNVCNGEIITHTYSITDDCGNETIVTHEITILAVPAPIDAGPDQIICLGDMVTISATNPLNAQLSWSPLVPNGPFSPAQTTTYTVTAENYGCISTDQVTITIEDAPIVSFFGDDLSGCAPHSVTFTNTSTSVSGMADCIWNINGQTVSSCATGTYTFEDPGTYDITLTTTSLAGCSATETYSQYIYVEEPPIASFIPSQNVLSSQFTEVSFNNNTTGASSYVWTFGDNSGTSTEENPTHTYPEIAPANYSVLLVASSDLGCLDSAQAAIVVNEELIYFIPNTFTPDGDDFNETFLPVFTEGYDPFDFHMMIYNRWGEIIWESYDSSVGWGGTYGFGGDLVQDGTYTWRIEFKTNMNDERKLIAGHVNLIR